MNTGPSPLQLKVFTGQSVAPYLDDLARLRIAVFREYPYLYIGSLDYERSYLKEYATHPHSILVVVTATEADTKRVIGISTGMPLAHEAPELQAPFHQQGVDITRIFYFGESVLEPAYRGQGIGKRFFEARQAHVDHLGGYDTTCFCAVIRPETHPRRPADYRPLDPFWRSLGYTPHPDRVAQLAWRDLDEPEETPKPMQFWLRPISQPQPQKER